MIKRWNEKKSFLDEKIDGKESEEIKSIYNHYINKRKYMNNTNFSVEQVFH